MISVQLFYIYEGNKTTLSICSGPRPHFISVFCPHGGVLNRSGFTNILIFPEHEFILSFVGYSFIFIYRTSLLYSYFYCYDRRMFGSNFGDVVCMMSS